MKDSRMILALVLWWLGVGAICFFAAQPADAQLPIPLMTGPDGTIYAPAYGVLPNAGDVSAPFQALINAMAASANGAKAGGFSAAKIRLGVGRTFAAVNFDVLPCVRLVGAGMGVGGSALVYNVAGPVVSRNLSGALGTVRVEISDLEVANANPLGDGVRIVGILGASIDRVRFTGGANGFRLDRVGNPPVPATNVHLTDCEFNGCSVAGAAAVGNMQFDNTVCTGCGVGLDLSGSLVLNETRLEENGTGMRLGLRDVTTGVVNTATLEANLIHLSVRKGAVIFAFNSLKVLGDKHAGTTLPSLGLDIQGGTDIEFHACDVRGGFTTAAVFMSQYVGPTLVTCTKAANAVGPVWNLQVPPANLSTIQTPISSTAVTAGPVKAYLEKQEQMLQKMNNQVPAKSNKSR